jgi:hypothetical protein
MPHAPDRHRGLDQQRSHAPLARLGNPPAPLALARAPLAGHQAQGSIPVTLAAEAMRAAPVAGPPSG